MNPVSKTIPHSQVEWEVDLAYEQGTADGFAQGVAWGAVMATVPTERKVSNYSAERLALRVVESESCYAAICAQLDRPEGYQYRGGPVDYETGLPEGSACAWLRRKNG